jgi:large subunit ribosomal protein L15
LNDLFSKSGKSENSKNTLDLESLKIEKLLGGGQINTAYTIKVKNATPSAIEKVKQAGGEVILPIQKTEEKTEEKTEDVENNDG